MSNGALTKAALYESKASVDKYIKSLGIPCAYFVAAGYMDLVKTFYLPAKVGCVPSRKACRIFWSMLSMLSILG